ncbi:MAG: alpha-1,4-glucan--maltose-1-phosphate maltosyltransferase [Candidatus Binatia bacterium]
MSVHEGRARVIIAGVYPQIDGGRFPIKCTIGDQVIIEADIFTDGHDAVVARLLHRHQDEESWQTTPLQPLVNDRWRAQFPAERLGRYYYTVEAWVDRFVSWRRDFAKRVEAGQDLTVEFQIGAELVVAASRRAKRADAKQLHEWAEFLRQDTAARAQAKTSLVVSDEFAGVVERYPDRTLAVRYEKELTVWVDRVKARFSAWYELFPRSCARSPGVHGTLQDCEAHLRDIAAMGFDVLYLPPIHPIGTTFRKGKNNALVAGPNDPGSPWAIGSPEGGHKAIHPQLGTLDDFRQLVTKAQEYGLEIALDIAFQCTPDHPYVKEHPEWFRHRPDGSIQYAENPPKKYQDIYPFDFETEHWKSLWEELRSVLFFWIEQGVRIFRVDNPHTKPFSFWQWVIAEVTRDYPDVIFLAEAFTRPKVMYRLAKLGFTQSYTYFAWRNTKPELTQYLTELTTTDVQEFFRPNFWPNTPDILTEYLQLGGRPAFLVRLTLAATLSANYGIYGPAFELCENRPREYGSEEYLDSEKYEIRQWDMTNPASLQEFITRVNRIRHENPALQSNHHLRFHDVDNEQLICYSKATAGETNVIVVVVNLDPHHTHGGWLTLSLDKLGLDARQPYQVHDLLSDARYLWHGARNYVELNPHSMPAHIFRVRRRVRSERDFDYYM